MALGPMQIIVVGFESNEPTGLVAPELKKLSEHGIIRLVDLLWLAKDEDGNITTAEIAGLDPAEAAEFGAVAGALAGIAMEGTEEGAEAGALLGAESALEGHTPLDGDHWAIADTIPAGTAAAIAIIEHKWAIPLNQAIEAAGGMSLADEWLHPEDLAGIGAHLVAEA